jgi:hypothetical protein
MAITSTTENNGYGSDLENAIARRSAIMAEIAAGGFGPNFSDKGRSVDLVGYRKSLLDELKMLNELIPQLAGCFEFREVIR